MRAIISLLLATAALCACSVQDRQTAEYLRKNPKIIFDVIEENPESFIASVNKAARKAQEGEQLKRQEAAKKDEEEQLKNPLRPALDQKRVLIGSSDAPITIVEYADFQCPACRLVHENLKPIKDKYKGKIQFYFKNMPLDFHPMAMPASLYFESFARQNPQKAQQFYDLLFQNQAELSESFLKETAKKLGADMKRLEKDMESAEVKAIIDSDRQEFEKFGFTGTPSIIINGVAANGAQPASEIDRIIQLTLKK